MTACFLPAPADAAFTRPESVGERLESRPTRETTPWWAAFHDAELDRLVAAAQAAALDPASPASQAADALLPARVAGTLIGLRAYRVRAALAADRVKVLQAQSQRMPKAPTPEAAARGAWIAKRLLAAQAVSESHAAERDRLAARLAALTGGASDRVAASLKGDSGTRALPPEFERPVPLRLPAAVLAARPDVARALAEARLARQPGADHDELRRRLQPLGGEIVASASGDGWLPPGAAQEAAADPLAATLDDAAGEVSRGLYALQAAERRSIVLARAAHETGVALDAARRQAAAGADAELVVLERYARLLAETDSVVAAKADVAMAWVRLELVTGQQ